MFEMIIMDPKPTIVIDLGSGSTKAGLADNEYPTCTIPSADEALKFPIEHGIIQDFDQVEKLLERVFVKELQLKPEEHPILLTQPPKNPQKDKEKLAEILFEKFNVPALYEEVHSVLTFYASGRSAGVIVESGHGVTSVVPILSGYAISEAILRLDIGGKDLNQYLIDQLANGPSNELISLQEAQILKEKLCFIPETNSTSTSAECYTLPDGRNINLDSPGQITDPLFNPALVGQYDTYGLHEMIFHSIFKCGFDLRREFASNIVLSGGNTLFRGLETRLRQELESRVPPSMKVNIIADSDREIFVWRGGSIVGGLSSFYKNICVLRQEYEEFGAVVVRKKCMNGL
ncbi:unnamed protein product [Ceutorhynchus assimilis]|uniref:Actin n=1 Tax=Ceutorhynchus assimilis TaxID=467358 RepID=A0A9N9MY54_9CUCU|nr:unnamed protein product [Ceutorhynchus assimilis]